MNNFLHEAEDSLPNRVQQETDEEDSSSESTAHSVDEAIDAGKTNTAIEPPRVIPPGAVYDTENRRFRN